MNIWNLLTLNPIIVFRSRAIERKNARELLENCSDYYPQAQFWTVLDATTDVIASQILSRIKKSYELPGLHVVEGLLTAMSNLSSIDTLQIQQALLEAYINIRSYSDRRLVLMDFPTGSGAISPEILKEILPEYLSEFPSPDGIVKILQARNFNLCDELLVSRCSGLTEAELAVGVENALRLNPQATSLELGQSLLIFREDLLRLEGLEFLNIPSSIEIGGLDLLQESLEVVCSNFSPTANAVGIAYPSGWLFVGPPGTGKTYTAKIVALRLGFPLINIGIENILSKGMESALYLKGILTRLAAIGRVVIYFDELDKFFPGGVQQTSESSRQVLGVLLTWLQDNESPIFTIGTLNRLEFLPPELTRIGRFDEIWYLGFPQPIERLLILFLHLAYKDKRYKIDPKMLKNSQLPSNFPFTSNQCETIASRLLNYTGAEIQQVVAIAYSHAWKNAGMPDYPPQVSIDDIFYAIKLVVSLFSRSSETILAMVNKSAGFAKKSSIEGLSAFKTEIGDPYTSHVTVQS
jgi:ATPase family associated with various cellular activities (AAA)